MKSAKSYLIFPLDVATVAEAKQYVTVLRDHVGIFKIGLELFIHAGPQVVHAVKDLAPESHIFLDLKLHDIPATVQRATQRMASLGVTYATVHCGESQKMLEAAVKGADDKIQLLGVTVLTSVSSQDIRSAGYDESMANSLTELVLKKADMAQKAGFAGVICSGHEAQQIKKHCGGSFLAVTPGIRPSWDLADGDDQSRVMTPARAIENGSDHLVIGRPIRNARDPAFAAGRVIEEIQDALSQ
jgi:orotidine-5'-phosphate decarboxylase